MIAEMEKTIETEYHSKVRTAEEGVCALPGLKDYSPKDLCLALRVPAVLKRDQGNGGADQQDSAGTV